MSDEKECQATDSKILREQIMDCRIGKNEREWWASREIEKLESERDALKAKVERLAKELKHSKALASYNAVQKERGS